MEKAAFSEVVALLLRNEGEERRAQDVEDDARRLLLLARDAKLRDQLVQAQGVRRVTLLAKSSSSIAVQRYCTGDAEFWAAWRTRNGEGSARAHVLGIRLAGDLCAPIWGCASHRHSCPLFMLLHASQCATDRSLRHVSAAALLAFSVQNECQLQIDTMSGLAVLLRIIEQADADGGDGELAVLAAAILWNMCKAPVLLLKLETLHALLKDRLLRMLSRNLLVPVEPFQLSLTLTGERGAAALLDFEGDNLNILLTSIISANLSVVLAVENYHGRSRTLADQYRPRSGGSNRIKSAGPGKRKAAGSSVANYDETGVLASRTCAMCNKVIRMNSSSSSTKKYLICAREGCGQTFHISCSRWAALNDENRHTEHFHCDVCRKSLPLYYWDFIAKNPQQYSKLLTQTMFDAVRITQFDTQVANADSKGDCVVLFDSTHTIVGAGDVKYKIAASSRDPETLIILLTHVLVGMYPAMQQRKHRRSFEETTASIKMIPNWPLSYAREDVSAVTPVGRGKKGKVNATESLPAGSTISIPLVPGRAYFWPTEYSQEVRALRYTECALDQLERSAIYEFKGGTDRESIEDGSGTSSISSFMFAVGAPMRTEDSTTAEYYGIWSALLPRKAACMKLLTEQIGRLRVCHSAAAGLSREVRPKVSNKSKTSSGSGGKPHFPGKRLNRVAVETV